MFTFATQKIFEMQVDLNQYSSIIFDFGGVILDIDPELSMNAFTALCGKEEYTKIIESGLLWEFEKGKISSEELQLKVNQQIEMPINEGEFKQAWNAMLLEYHPERINFLKQLRQSHQLIMLSNTNQVHFDYFSNKLNEEYGVTFQDLFHTVYLSHEMGMIKPDIRIFEQVVKEQNLIPEKTLFIEDTKENATAAATLGINTFVIPRNDNYYNYMKR